MHCASLPTTMPAIAIAAPGPAEVLTPVARAVPQPAEDEVLIEVAAAGVNRPDVLQRQGKYPPPPGASDLPGLEVAGTVVALGAGVSRWRLGDRVCALLAGGGYAAYATAPEGQCMPVPQGLDLVAAAALPETVLTVWHNVWQRAALAPGESLLVHGGASGIGVAALQIGRALGHRVFATAGTPAKCAACEALGAERAIDYRTEDFAAVVRELTRGRGVDVVLDMVAGDYLARDLACLAPDGRIAVIAALGGSHANLPTGLLLQKRAALLASTLRNRPVAWKSALCREVEARVWPLVEAGAVRAVVDRVFPLAEAAAAHAWLESGAHVGKVMLTLR
jgi:NADPH2:quinone reductase